MKTFNEYFKEDVDQLEEGWIKNTIISLLAAGSLATTILPASIAHFRSPNRGITAVNNGQSIDVEIKDPTRKSKEKLDVQVKVDPSIDKDVEFDGKTIVFRDTFDGDSYDDLRDQINHRLEKVGMHAHNRKVTQSSQVELTAHNAGSGMGVSYTGNTGVKIGNGLQVSQTTTVDEIRFADEIIEDLISIGWASADIALLVVSVLAGYGAFAGPSQQMRRRKYEEMKRNKDAARAALKAAKEDEKMRKAEAKAQVAAVEKEVRKKKTK